MKSEEIQHLLSFIASSGLDEVNIETENFKLAVKRSAAPVIMQAPAQAAPLQAPLSAPAALPMPTAATAAAAPAPAAPAASNTVTQKSPMIGTFYASSSPENPAMVQVGDTVKKGQIICIIEAMKLFNEIESDFSGVIRQVLINNATPVQYDEPLFIIEPA